VELSSEGFWARCGGELVSCIICGAQCSVRASRLLSPWGTSSKFKQRTQSQINLLSTCQVTDKFLISSEDLPLVRGCKNKINEAPRFQDN
jgi:hypothetical protein